ncbi:MAG: glycine cleavage system protein GcvH [Thermodesulfobacteriota bacterium]
MADIPENLKYTEEHEWARIEDEVVVIGITDFAQEALGEIVFVELPSEGQELEIGDTFGGVESTKSVSDLFSPISGDVVEVNELLLDSPENINTDPYGEGWIIKISPSNTDEFDELMEPSEYSEYIENLDEN